MYKSLGPMACAGFSVAEGTMTINAPESERGLAAVAYILTWITGLIVLLTAKKEERFKRWHAIQAIGLGIAVAIVYFVLNFLVAGILLAGAASSSGAAAGVGITAMIMGLMWIAVIILIILLAVKAYQGHMVRLPVIAGFADKNA